MNIIDRSLPRSADIEPDFFSAQIAGARRFWMNLKPSRLTPLAVICGGLERCAPDYHIVRRSFRYYALEFVASGKGELVLGGVAQPLTPGCVFTYGLGFPHEIKSDQKQPLTKYFVDFFGLRARRLLESCGLLPGTIVQTSAPETIVRLMEDIKSAAQRRGPRSLEICSLLLEQLLQSLFETAVPANSLNTGAFNTFQRCRHYIDEHYPKIESLKEVSKQCDVNAAYLSRLFQRFGKEGAYQYLMKLKMNDAAQLLLRPGTLVKEVASQLRFCDQFHFSRAFRRVYGISPRDLQQLHDLRPNGWVFEKL